MIVLNKHSSIWLVLNFYKHLFLLSYHYIKKQLKKIDFKPSGVHNPGRELYKLSYEVLVDSICSCFNIKKKYFDFFKTKPCFYLSSELLFGFIKSTRSFKVNFYGLF